MNEKEKSEKGPFVRFLKGADRFFLGRKIIFPTFFCGKNVWLLYPLGNLVRESACAFHLIKIFPSLYLKCFLACTGAAMRFKPFFLSSSGRSARYIALPLLTLKRSRKKKPGVLFLLKKLACALYYMYRYIRNMLKKRMKYDSLRRGSQPPHQRHRRGGLSLRQHRLLHHSLTI